MKRSACIAVLLTMGLARRAGAQFPPAPGTGPGLPETIEAIESARVTTRILCITAHPDDEPGPVLTYLARGLHADVALLSLTRGEGGQNALGPEQAPQLGLIRTQELLAATRGYGVRLYFTRAKDFGFSKTPEETMKVWGEPVLEDMVRVIRTFRPHIVINNWGGVRTGHGHHQAAGLLTPKAVQMAADEKAFPEQLKEGLQTWGGKERVQVLVFERGADSPKGFPLPLDEVSPLWAKTWRQLGLDAFVNHRTQGIAGFLNSPFVRRQIWLIGEDGTKPDAAKFARTLEVLGGSADPNGCAAHAGSCQALGDADAKILAARQEAFSLNLAGAAKALSEAQNLLLSVLPGDVAPSRWREGDPLLADVANAHRRVLEALALAEGVQVTAEADRGKVVKGETLHVTATMRCRIAAACESRPLRLESGALGPSEAQGDGKKGFQFTVHVEKTPPPLPVWEQLQPEPPPLLRVLRQEAGGGGMLYYRETPVVYTQASSTRVDKVPVRIVPAITLSVDPKLSILRLGLNAANARKTIPVYVRAHCNATAGLKATVGLGVPEGWATSAAQTAEFKGQGDQYFRFTVTPPAKAAAASYSLGAFAETGGEKFTASVEPLPSLSTQHWTEAAESRVQVFDVKVPENLRVGYITAEGEPIPEALGRLGIRVEMLDATALAFGDLSRFDAIVVGVRAYELRPDLAGANARLLQYAERGGTLMVQYNRDNVWDRLQPAPYPAKIGNPTPRITDENSAVRFLKPDDPLLNAPNKITASDFTGWVQERGLYYWSQYDGKYTALLGMNDPGEGELTGGLVYARYGKGMYIYTGLAFFRQLPEGVPGAYRLFVNLVSASRVRKEAR